MHSGILWQVIYWSPIPVLAALILILLQRRVVREFPLFFCYLLVDCTKDILLFSVYHFFYSLRTYYYAYWITHVASSLLLLLATFELSLTRLFPHFYKLKFYRQLFSAAALLAIGFGVFAVYGGRRWDMAGKVIHLTDSLHVIALVFFVSLMQLMGRRWARYEFAIALGMGVNAIALVVVFVLFLRYGPVQGPVRELAAIADALVCWIWLLTFLRPEKRVVPSAAPISPEVLHQARQWEEALKESLSRKKPAS